MKKPADGGSHIHDDNVSEHVDLCCSPPYHRTPLTVGGELECSGIGFDEVDRQDTGLLVGLPYRKQDDSVEDLIPSR